MTGELASERIELDSPDRVGEYFSERGWTDGLPIVPPTDSRVAEFLHACHRHAGEVVLKVPARGRAVTAEKVAINAVMAGCLPEYAPVVMAAAEAMEDPDFNLHGGTASTQGAAILVIINGPVRKRLGFNSGGNLLGPGCRANATVGRALRLVIMNCCGGQPGTLDRATFGHPGKYTFCFAEDEESSPWEPLHVERGFPAGSSTVSLMPALSPIQTFDHLHRTPEGVVGHLAAAIAGFGAPLQEVVVVISPEHLWHIRRAGWTRARVKDHLYSSAQTTVAHRKALGLDEGEASPEDGHVAVGVLKSPQSCIVVAGGGDAGGFSLIIPPWSFGARCRMVTKAIKE